MLALVSLLAGGGLWAWWYLPRFVEARVRHASERVGILLGLHVELGSVELEGLSAVWLRNVRITEASDTRQLLAEFPSIKVSIERPSLRPRVTEVRLVGGTVHVVREAAGDGPLWRLAKRLRGILQGGDDGPTAPEASESGLLSLIERGVPTVGWSEGVVALSGLIPEALSRELPALAAARLTGVTLTLENRSRRLDRFEIAATLAGSIDGLGGTLRVETAEALGQRSVSVLLEGPVQARLGGADIAVDRVSWHGAPVVELQGIRVGGLLSAQAMSVALRPDLSRCGEPPAPGVEPAADGCGGLVLAEGLRDTLGRVDEVVARGVRVDATALSIALSPSQPGGPRGPAPFGPPRSLERPATDPVRGAVARGVISTAFSRLAARAELLRFRTGELLGRVPVRHLLVEDLVLSSAPLAAAGTPDQGAAPLLPPGPYRLEATRYPGHVQVDVAASGASPGTLSVSFQHESGDVTLHAASPGLSLPLGGIALGDTDVTVSLSHTGAHAFAGRVQVSGLSVESRAVARVPVALPPLAVDGSVTLDAATASVRIKGATVGFGDVRAKVSLDLSDLREAPVVSLDFDMPETPATAVVSAVPTALLGPLAGLEMDGRFSWRLVASVDLRDPTTLDYSATAKPVGLVVRSMGSIDPKGLSSRFPITVRENDGSTSQLDVGPGTGRWLPYSQVSPWMAKVLTTTEDGSFLNHRGISYFAIHDAIVQNLEVGRFQRGASTLTQQLVKNVFLTQEKTLARKLQEVFLAWQLEKLLSKERILELYLNVVELGPGIYGLKRAASHYFDKAAKDLDPLECAFVASLLPSPRKYYREFRRGKVSEGWRKRLQTTLKVMVERGKLTQPEFEALAPYSPHFRER